MASSWSSAVASILLSEASPTLVGIDHGFSFALKYFEQHGLPLDWPSFLDDFQRHWPTDKDIMVATGGHVPQSR